MNVCISNHNTGKNICCNALRGSEILGIEPHELYLMKNRNQSEYRHFSIIYNVEILKKRPSGRPYEKGESGYLKFLKGKAK